MATVIKLKRSETASSAPTTSDLVVGEVAINTADQIAYIRDSGNSIVKFATSLQGIFLSELELTWFLLFQASLIIFSKEFVFIMQL